MVPNSQSPVHPMAFEVVPYHKEMVDGMSIAPMLALACASVGPKV